MDYIYKYVCILKIFMHKVLIICCVCVKFCVAIIRQFLKILGLFLRTRIHFPSLYDSPYRHTATHNFEPFFARNQHRLWSLQHLKIPRVHHVMHFHPRIYAPLPINPACTPNPSLGGEPNKYR